MQTLLQSVKHDEIALLVRRAESLQAEGSCCPRRCGMNRRDTKTPCGAEGGLVRVAAFHAHKGEEPPVSGTHGAGNVFFSGCTLSCVFCQNFPFSHLHNGRDYTTEQFAERILELQARGVHNLNFTTFDHYIAEVLRALLIVKDEICIPVSNNCSGFFMPETLSLALSFCDIFLYDMKYADPLLAARYSEGHDYVERCRSGLDMIRNEELTWIEEDGILKQGLIVRHLVLPGAVSNTLAVMDYLAGQRDAGLDFAFSLMAQYFPAYRSCEFPEIDRKLTEDEYMTALERMEELGFEGWAQDHEAEGGC
jgi:putative pyruvate formate lyase activating enzyme